MFGASFEGSFTTNRIHSKNLNEINRPAGSGYWSGNSYSSVFQVIQLKTVITFSNQISLRGSVYVQ
jgi:hypothetical protein